MFKKRRKPKQNPPEKKKTKTKQNPPNIDQLWPKPTAGSPSPATFLPNPESKSVSNASKLKPRGEG
jgi:hypothetical protein